MVVPIAQRRIEAAFSAACGFLSPFFQAFLATHAPFGATCVPFDRREHQGGCLWDGPRASPSWTERRNSLLEQRRPRLSPLHRSWKHDRSTNNRRIDDVQLHFQARKKDLRTSKDVARPVLALQFAGKLLLCAPATDIYRKSILGNGSAAPKCCSGRRRRDG